MIINKNFLSLFFTFVIVFSVVFPAFSEAEEPVEIFTLKQTIENAIKANIGLQSSKEGTRAALFAKKNQRTYFLPTLSATYRYKRNDDENYFEETVLEDEYSFVASFNQPLFTGFDLINRYKIASLGLDVARIDEKLARQEVIFEAKKLYFSLLKAQKIMSVAQEAVTQLSAHKEVAENFYQVGMTPLNDLLKAQVELANTKQDFIVAQNNFEIAKSNFNIFLRRPINSPVQIKDVLDYTTFGYNIDYCLGEAEKNRLEITTADLNVEIGEKELKLARKDYYPYISLQGNYYRMGTQPDVSDPSSWDIQAVATWNFWEWGRSHYGVKEKNSRLLQARHQKEEIRDSIRLEVKQAFLKTRESEKNIITVDKAIEQAKENFRISEERYKEQMATSTDVLDAQTLLSKTKTNYYNALYDYKISKAALYRAMSQEIIE